jgi:hypothetical protein
MERRIRLSLPSAGRRFSASGFNFITVAADVSPLTAAVRLINQSRLTSAATLRKENTMNDNLNQNPISMPGFVPLKNGKAGSAGFNPEESGAS